MFFYDIIRGLFSPSVSEMVREKLVKKCCHNYSEPDMISETPRVCVARDTKKETSCTAVACCCCCCLVVGFGLFHKNVFQSERCKTLKRVCGNTLCSTHVPVRVLTVEVCRQGLSDTSTGVRTKRRPARRSFCLSLLRSLSPSNKSASHVCVTLPSAPSRSVRPFCLPPLAFIRTVDGESRTEAICTTPGTDAHAKHCHM